MESNLQELQNLIGKEIGFSRFHFKLKDEECLRYLDFGTDEDGLSIEFQDEQIKYLSKVLTETPEDSILALNQADERKRAIYFLESEMWEKDFGHIQEMISNVGKNDLSKYEEDDFIGIQYFVSRFNLTGNHSLVTFKVVSPFQTIYTDKAMRRKDKGYAKPKNNLFRIPHNFDFFVYNGVLFITNLDTFEKKNSELLAQFRERETDKTMAIIERQNMLSKEVCDTLREYLKEDETLSKKIVKAKDRLQTSSKPINEIAVISYIRESFSGYNLIEDGNIVLKSKKNARDFVNVFCDEYLRSGLTGHAYNVKASNVLAEKR